MAEFNCPHCGLHKTVASKYVGRLVQCPNCGARSVCGAEGAPQKHQQVVKPLMPEEVVEPSFVRRSKRSSPIRWILPATVIAVAIGSYAAWRISTTEPDKRRASNPTETTDGEHAAKDTKTEEQAESIDLVEAATAAQQSEPQPEGLWFAPESPTSIALEVLVRALEIAGYNTIVNEPDRLIAVKDNRSIAYAFDDGALTQCAFVESADTFGFESVAGCTLMAASAMGSLRDRTDAECSQELETRMIADGLLIDDSDKEYDLVGQGLAETTGRWLWRGHLVTFRVGKTGDKMTYSAVVTYHE